MSEYVRNSMWEWFACLSSALAPRRMFFERFPFGVALFGVALARFPFGVALFGAALARFGVRTPALAAFFSMAIFWLFQPSARRGVCAASANNSASSDTDACQYDMVVFQTHVD